MILILFLFVIVPNVVSAAENCITCVGSGSTWCVESSQCNYTFSVCQTPITLQLNCLTSPNPKYAYDDDFMRTQQLVLASASHGDKIQTCFDNQIPTMKLFRVRTVNCPADNSNITCLGFTAYDVSQNAIIISFRGSHGEDQSQVLFDGMTRYGLHSYFGVNGKFFKIIYDWFMLLWNGGMQQDLRHLKYKYPTYELWVNGHSLGASLAWAASAWIVNIGLYKPDEMKVVVMGASRISDYNFAAWHTQTFPYNFHILHRSDPVAHTPTFVASTNTTLFYPKTEVWYNNFMNQGDPYQVCQEADGDYCSGSVNPNATQYIDHLYYFNIDLPGWGHAGCPMNISAYAQP